MAETMPIVHNLSRPYWL